MEKWKSEYDELSRAKARSTATLRGVVACYLVYLGYTLIRDLLRGSSTLPLWAAWAAGLGFCTAGAAFGLFAWKRYRAALEAAKLPPREERPPEL